MPLRPLGSTGLVVSPIGLGLAALGRPGYINLGRADDLPPPADRSVEAMEAACHAVLDAAWAAGVHYLDAARSYGRAEAFLASWLAARNRQPGELTVGSKWGYTYTGGWRVDAERHEVKDHSAATLRRQWRETRELLGHFVGLYQIHSATLDSGVLDDDEVLDELAGLRDAGLAVGLSLSGPGQAATLARARAVERDGVPLFATVQATWNLLEPSAGPALAEAHDAGMAVIVKEALANGRLTGRGDRPVGDATALAAAMAQPFADVVLSGAATVDQLRSNLAALAVTDPLEAVAGVPAEAPAGYWEHRSRLPWA
jgi:aryl-alcohol dehydrogenase-like predicted oxidoreductase